MIWNLKSYGKRVAIEENDVIYTYSDLYDMTEEIRSLFERKSLIFVLSQNTLGSLVGYLSFLNYGMVPLMLEENIDRNLLNNLINEYKPDYFWIPDKDVQGFPHYQKIFSKYEYALLKTEKENSCRIDPELALLVNTSGSIGSPKLVRQSYSNIQSNAASIVEYLHISECEKAITSLPMNYVYGLSVINSHMMAGGSIVLTNLKCYMNDFWKLVTDKKVTSFSGVPFMYEMLYKLKFTKKDIPFLKTFTQAGGKLSPMLQEYFAKYALENGKRFYIMYGASEATSRMSYLPEKDALRKINSIGIAIPGGRFELIDEKGKIINDSNKTGELVYYGPNVMLGYSHTREDLQKSDEMNGKLLTGDMAYKDDEGYYYIIGRKTRFIKILGKRLSLDETEMLLKKKFFGQIACAGKDDLLYIFVTDETLVNDISSYIDEILQINHALFKVRVIKEIPKNESGKILYSELNKLL